MRYLLYLIKKYPFSCLCIAAIWVLCLMPVPETPLQDVALADKWAHLIMYGGTCSMIWIEYLRRHSRINWQRCIVLAVVGPIMMSGVIELLQAYCTFGMRSGDWLDFLANSIGVMIGLIFGILLAAYCARAHKEDDGGENCRNAGRQ